MNESSFPSMDAKFAKEGLTFDDVLLLPAESEFSPGEADTKTYLTSNIQLNIPISSSAMDTVTEAELAIALAREGGIGIIHRNLPIKRQVEEVDKVKRSESGMIEHPITLTSDKTVADALEVTAFFKIGGVPIVSEDGVLIGMITNRDLKYEDNYDTPVTKLMTPFEKLVTAPPGINLEDAKKILHRIRKEKLPIVDDDYRLHGLITIKDIDKIRQYPTSCKDESGRLRVGAAVSPSSSLDEIGMLVEARADVLVIDTAHGHSKAVVRAIQMVKTEFPTVDLIVGNVVTGDATQRLIDAGADGIKVGIRRLQFAQFFRRATLLQRATGVTIRQQHGFFRRQNLRRLRHKMNATKDNDSCIGLGCLPCEAKRVAHVVCQVLNLRHLIIMRKHHSVEIVLEL